MRTARDLVPDPVSGSVTDIEIAASPHQVWDALLALRFADLKISQPLLAARALPSLLAGGKRPEDMGSVTMIDGMLAGRFVELDRHAPVGITIGLVGQFWRLDGGRDADVRRVEDFVVFDKPGYIKTAMDFVIEGGETSTTVTTTTANMATDAAAAKKFGRYWRVVGPGSKAIRIDMLRALKRTAEA